MADTTEGIEQQVESMILAGFAQQGDEQDTTQDGTEERRVIDVDLYRLEGGAVLLVPNNGSNSLDENAIESVTPTTQDEATPITETPPIPLVDVEQKEEIPQEQEPEPITPTSTKRRVKPSFVLVSLVLLCILAAGIASYLFLLPLTATATITITPKAKSLHTDTTFTIATNPKAGQVHGRPLEAISFTKSKTVPATGHAHDDARSATGEMVFYNTDITPVSIPAGITFTVNGIGIVTDNAVTIPAAIPPVDSQAVTYAHALQAGSQGNIPAGAVYTHCCQASVIATNVTPFTGGQDARSYSFIQSSDIQNAATDLLANLTPQATVSLQKQARTGEQLVTPLCSPRTISSQQPGTESASITVSVTQTCYSVAYIQNSLEQVATSTLARMATLANFAEVGTTQVTVNGSTYTNHTALLKVSLSGAWVYRFTKQELTQLTRQIAGEGQEQAKATIRKLDGVAQVSIHLQRLDFRNSLPTNPQRINVQFFYLVL